MSDIANNFPITLAPSGSSRVGDMDFDNIVFGRVFSDNQLIIDYKDGAWTDARIVKYEEVPMSLAISALHYGQAIFEGMKAQMAPDGTPLLFRPEDNLARLNVSAARMCMPELPKELFMQGLTSLLKIDKAWIPSKEGSGLYIRPFMFATDAFIGVRPSETYRFSIFTCPVNAYYLQPLKVKVSTQYSRAIQGGVGFAKCAGNYGAQMLATREAQAEGYMQVLWTDALEHKYIEETGTTNVFIRKGDTVVTPPLDGTILAGITRDSVIKLLTHWGIKVEERPISVDELTGGIKSGEITEFFATGTAATLVPIVVLNYDGVDYTLNNHENWGYAGKLAKTLDEIKTGKTGDPFGWVMKVV